MQSCSSKVQEWSWKWAESHPQLSWDNYIGIIYLIQDYFSSEHVQTLMDKTPTVLPVSINQRNYYRMFAEGDIAPTGVIKLPLTQAVTRLQMSVSLCTRCSELVKVSLTGHFIKGLLCKSLFRPKFCCCCQTKSWLNIRSHSIPSSLNISL